ncbi:probable blue pigment (indigoidine) exporter [Mameliella alba]|uniref:EamA family transporter n=1 Tax=Mameliella alba TaxID=561184 RepID=UPI00088CF2EC|nr:EamA family transporter [Mameliella alba]OWV45316.1 EamA family transporter [Mameliella alba]PTR36786.1 putative blue pigment (indigoidine) exporter [Mameliella alba]GGF77804.1 ABC transporter permease [Mameliella alba]SDD88802.1 probable blue pigment (indigoidine) exporter [Mameliella alba]
MSRTTDIFLTALAPAIWGSTYLVTTEALPDGYPVTLAALRALPAGLLLLAVTRCLPPRAWLGRTFLLGSFNFALFWVLLFVAAYRLPGGVAATLGAVQTMIVILMARGWLGTPIRAGAVAASAAGVLGVALLLIGPEARLDPVGVAAGLGGAASMAAGTVLSRKWQPPVSALSFTAWQLTAGGLILLPLALIAEPPLPPLTATNLAGLTWLGLVGAAATYVIWFRGVARIEPGAISMLSLMSPLTAVILGWAWLGQALTPVQAVGAVIVLGSVWAGQRANRPSAAPAVAPIPAGVKPPA